MVFHQEPRLPVDVDHTEDREPLQKETSPVTHDDDTYQRFAKTMMDIKRTMEELGSANIKKEQARQKKNFDKRHLIPSYKCWDVDTPEELTRQARQGGKMDSHFTGSYDICEEIGKGVYKIKKIRRPTKFYSNHTTRSDSRCITAQRQSLIQTAQRQSSIQIQRRRVNGSQLNTSNHRHPNG